MSKDFFIQFFRLKNQKIERDKLYVHTAGENLLNCCQKWFGLWTNLIFAWLIKRRKHQEKVKKFSAELSWPLHRLTGQTDRARCLYEFQSVFLISNHIHRNDDLLGFSGLFFLSSNSFGALATVMADGTGTRACRSRDSFARSGTRRMNKKEDDDDDDDRKEKERKKETSL